MPTPVEIWANFSGTNSSGQRPFVIKGDVSAGGTVSATEILSGDAGYDRYGLPSNLVFDTANNLFFVQETYLGAGSTGAEKFRILEGRISDFLSTNAALHVLTAVYDSGTDSTHNAEEADGRSGLTFGGAIVAGNGLAVDGASHTLYFADSPDQSVGGNAPYLEKITYSTTAQAAGTGHAVVARPNVVGSSNADGSGNGTGFPGFIPGVALDTAHGYAYLTNEDDFNGTTDANYILRVTLATGAVSKVSIGSGFAAMTAAQESTTDGTIQGNFFNPANGTLAGIAIDPTTQLLYFSTDGMTDPSGNVSRGGIYSLNLATSAVTALYTLAGANYGDISIDPSSGKFYVELKNGAAGLYSGSLTTAGTPIKLFDSSTAAAADRTTGATLLHFASDVAPAETGSGSFGNTTETAGANSGLSGAGGASVTITDPDGLIQSATVSITTGFQTGTTHQDVLTLGNTGLGIAGSYSSTTGVLTLNGVASAATYTTALSSVQFAVSGDNPTVYGTDTTRTITTTLFDGLVSSAPYSAVATVTATNDAPVVTGPATVAGTEDTAIVFSGANGNTLSVSDADANPASQALSVMLVVSYGSTVQFASTTGLTFTSGTAGAANSMSTFTGTANAINAAFAAGFTYVPGADHNGSDSISVSVSDQGATGSGTPATTNFTVPITLSAVPDIVADTATTAEDTAVAITVQSNDNFEDSRHQIYSVSTPAHGSALINSNGTPNDYFDDYVVYTPAANYNGTDSFTYTVMAGGVTESASATVTVSPVNDPPRVDLNGAATGSSASLAYVENGAAAAIAPAATIVDIDSADVNGGSLTVAFTANGTTADQLTIQNQGTAAGQIGVTGSTVSYGGTTIGTVSGGANGSSLVVAFTTAAATPAAATALAEHIAYANTSDSPSTAARTVVFTLDDGDGGSSTGSAVATVSVTAVNDAPNFAASGAQPAYTENAPYTTLAPAVTLTDDNTTFTNGMLTVALTSPPINGDSIGIHSTADGSGIVLNSSTGAISYNGTVFATLTSASATSTTATFNASATTTSIAALAQAATYTSTSEDPGSANRTVAFTLVDGGGTANWGADTTSFTRTVTVTPVDDAPVAVADTATTVETTAVMIGVVANDTDVDGGPKAVATINGTAVAAGGSVTLASGAIATLNANGTIGYDPHHSFDYLAGPSSGAANTTATDSFTYALNGGSSTIVAVTITGVDGTGDQPRGSAGNDTITTTSATGSNFDLSQGGDDTVTGGPGNDSFYFGAMLTGADHIDGSGGANDQVGISGDYTGTNHLVLAATTLTNVEVLAVLPGHGYDITSADGNVAAGGALTIFGGNLGANDSLVFNGAAETDGSFMMFGGQGADTLTGGAGNDGFYFGPGRYDPTIDTVHGGGGSNDQLALDGAYTVTLNSHADVEVVVLLAGPSGAPNTFNISVDDSFVAAGGSKTIYASQVTTALTINASGEHDGGLTILGGQADDAITGTATSDVIYGGLGQDVLTGGAGNDVFRYDSIAESTTAAPDAITDFTLGDKIDLSRIDANTTTQQTDDSFTFGTGATFHGQAGELIVAPLGGNVFQLQGDVNGDGVADFAINVTITDGHTLTTAHIVL